jgi:hypothetical protein
MQYAGAFGWWMVSITFNILFVIAASTYLYVHRRNRGSGTPRGTGRILRVVKDFTFVWILLGLLLFYVYSVGEGSSFVFALGNIVVEVILVVYVVRSGDS